MFIGAEDEGSEIDSRVFCSAAYTQSSGFMMVFLSQVCCRSSDSISVADRGSSECECVCVRAHMWMFGGNRAEFSIHFKKFIYFCMAVVGLCCHTQAFSSCAQWGLLSGYSVRASHLQELLLLQSMRSQARGLLQLRVMGLVALWQVGSSWIGDQTLSPALAGRFLTTEPPRKPCIHSYVCCWLKWHWSVNQVKDFENFLQLLILFLHEIVI